MKRMDAVLGMENRTICFEMQEKNFRRTRSDTGFSCRDAVNHRYGKTTIKFTIIGLSQRASGTHVECWT